ncbi:MAG: NUDIX domain-containing protein [Gemmatimonadaceae bacterium]
MRDRGISSINPTRASSRRSSFSIDVILFTPRGKQLAALCVRADDPRARERWLLPSDFAASDEALETAARRIAKDACGVEPTWMEQVGAFGDGKRHPADVDLSVAFAAVVPADDAAAGRAERAWFGVSEPPALAPRQRAMLDAALAALRTRMDHAPIAFRLLPEMFTLSELQVMYELLLGKRLHKASFRRALQATSLVEATDEWRSEGRGRPAQFFRFSPRKRRGTGRGVRFDLL